MKTQMKENEAVKCEIPETLDRKKSLLLETKQRPLTCDAAPTAGIFLGFLGVGGGSWHTPLGSHVTPGPYLPRHASSGGQLSPSPPAPPPAFLNRAFLLLEENIVINLF
jgi:hypothetical protein